MAIPQRNAPPGYLIGPDGHTLVKISDYPSPEDARSARPLPHPRARVRPKPHNVKGMQAFLKAKGYAIPVDGIAGALTQAAAKNWRSSRTPGRFNKNHGLTHDGPAGNAGPPAQDHSQRSRAPGGGGGGRSRLDPMAGLDASLSGDLKSLEKLARQGAPVPLSRLSKLGTPESIAAHDAALKYGAAIAGMGRDIGTARGQGTQNLADIASWFGQVRGHLDDATTADAAAGERNVAAQAASDQGIISSLGGAANVAAPDLAREAETSTGTLRALQLAQQNADRSAQTQLGAEAASARVRQQNMDEQRVADLVGKLRDTQTEKGAYQASTLDSAREQRLSDEMNIRGFNEQMRGNKFQQKASIPGLRISAGMAGIEQQAARTDIAAKRVAIKQANWELRHPLAASHGSKVGRDLRLSQNDQGKAVDAIIGHLRTPVTVNTGGIKTTHGQFAGHPEQAASYVAGALKGYGINPNSPQGREIALTILSAGVKGFDPKVYNRLLGGKPPRPRKRKR